MSMTSRGILRGCGTRERDHIYWECGTSNSGVSIVEFLRDPPILLDPNFNICDSGVTTYVRNGITHVIDVVGKEAYPNVCDFIEEWRRFGLSRKISRNFKFSDLTPGPEGSKLLLVHQKAWIDNHMDYAAAETPSLFADQADIPDGWTCPKCLTKHELGHEDFNTASCCAGVWWEDVTLGVPFDKERDEIEFFERMRANDQACANRESDTRLKYAAQHPINYTTRDEHYHPRLVRREMPSFSYYARRRPSGVRPRYRYAIFATAPLTRFAVVKGEESYKSYDRLSKLNLPVAHVDE